MRGAAYSEFTSRLTGLLGLDTGDFNASEIAITNGFFNRAIRKIWEANSWIDVCPFGESRIPSNLLSSGNDFASVTTAWTTTAITPTAKSIANPRDGRVTATKCLETTATSAHGFSQTLSYFPLAQYRITAPLRPITRQWQYVSANDGVTTYSAFFNTFTGALGAVSTNAQATMQQVNNGFYLCQLSFTAASSATSGTLQILAASNSSTTSYAGNTADGFYIDYAQAVNTSMVSPSDLVISDTQGNETAIDVIFDVFQSDPNARIPGSRIGYTRTTGGTQLIGPTAPDPVWLYYRKQRPVFSGPTLDLASSYSTGFTVFYTTSAAAGTSDYYQCIVATTPTQTPDSTPNSWQILTVPYEFFEYCVYSAMSDWFRVNGQIQKAQAMDSFAQGCMDDAADKMERQQGQPQPLKVATHVSQQSRTQGSYAMATLPGN